VVFLCFLVGLGGADLGERGSSKPLASDATVLLRMFYPEQKSPADPDQCSIRANGKISRARRNVPDSPPERCSIKGHFCPPLPNSRQLLDSPLLPRPPA
jgi:hypothetical protein